MLATAGMSASVEERGDAGLNRMSAAARKPSAAEIRHTFFKMILLTQMFYMLYSTEAIELVE